MIPWRCGESGDHMTSETSQMRREIAEIPRAVERLIMAGLPEIRDAARIARARDPLLIATVARGSSDHACTLVKYACEIACGLPVASLGPSIASVYRAPLRLERALTLCVSQSGQSPDLVEMAQAARRGGSLTLAMVNNPASPLAAAADLALDIRAGAERSVAATKSFVNSAVAGLALVAELAGDTRPISAIEALPERLERAISADWSELAAALSGAASLYTLGRGPASAVSAEAALKLKETCQIHAETFSSAEVLHGPVSIVGPEFPVLAFAAQ